MHPPHQLKAPTFQHAERGDSFIEAEIPHYPELANGFFNPPTFSALYLTLFPDGVGGRLRVYTTVAIDWNEGHAFPVVNVYHKV